MNRLRVRVELNRRKAGVPLDEMVSVVEETRKFFHLLAEDVEIEPGRGGWLASDFDPESLNFTAEYKGSASAEQIRDFGAAFSGSTSLRQETISQFTHIAELIGEDELVGLACTSPIRRLSHPIGDVCRGAMRSVFRMRSSSWRKRWENRSLHFRGSLMAARGDGGCSRIGVSGDAGNGPV